MQTKLLTIVLFIMVFSLSAAAQGTEFTYQGSMKDGANPANGSFDFEFLLFDTLAGANQIGSTLTKSGVTVTNGIFSVKLDFGSNYPGASRFLEIRVRVTGGGAFTPLTPRQQVNSSPYSVKALSSETAATAANSLQLGGVVANQFVITTDPRMTDARNPLPNSENYIQNTTTPQTASNFNIAGNGTAGGTLSANAVNSTTQYNIGGNRVLTTSSISGNIFVGIGTGTANTGSGNSFFGNSAGEDNSTGGSNSFFGISAGQANTTGGSNSFFGSSAGRDSTGSHNSFFGGFAGFSNTFGILNSFFGRSAGLANTTGSNNTIIGTSANVGSGNLSYATAIGADSVVSASNTVVLGRAADIVRVPGSFNSAGVMSTNSNLTVLGTSTLIGKVDVATLGAAGSTDVCRNASNELSTCSSSLRYKTGINPFFGGLDVVRRLHPIAFNWKDGGMHDVGFGAEDVERVEPLLTTRNDKGEIEGVKYGQITTVLVNAVKEQQTAIESQQKKIETLEDQVKALTLLVCTNNKDAEICKPQPQ